MAEEIGSLEIQIQAQATKANNAIDKLITKLDRLSTSLGSINSSSLVGLANGVNRLANSMQGMNNVKTADFTRIATGVQKLANIDTASINRAASAMTQIGKAVNGISVSTGASTQIAELAKGIAQLGYKSSTQAIENIPKLAVAMKQLMTTLSKAPTVSQNLINMTNALAKLARTGSSSGKAATSLANSLNVFSKSASRAKTSSFSLAAAFGKMYASYWLLFRAFRKVKEMINLSSALTEVQNVVDVTFGNMASKVEEFSKTSIQQLGMSELAFKQYASRFQAMGSAMGINPSLIENANSFLSKQTDGYIGLSDSMSDVSINLTKLAADMASFYNVEQSAVAEDLESIFTGMTRPLRAYGLDLTEATLKEWALKNGLDADIDSMSQAQKTMLRYQYVLANTGAAQNDFARTSGTWANQVRILTENFKALGTIIGSWFVNALKPLVRALNQAMQYVIAFAETVTNALGSIFGWKFEVSGGGVADDWSDSMDGFSDSLGDAADNAKKLNKQLRAFDELNVINQKDSSGSGSGSGAGAGGASGAQGQIVPAETIFKDYESNIKTLEQLGNKIRDSLIGAMESIDWDSIYEGARNFGKGLAEFLNGLISPELFGALGRTIAGCINTALHFLDSFGETFDFANFGLSIAAGINEFMYAIDWETALSAARNWGTGIANALNTFLGNTDFIAVGATVANALNTAIELAFSFGSTFDFAQVGVAITNSINGFFRTFDFAKLAKTLNVWVDGLGKAILAALGNLDVGAIVSGISEFIGNLELDTIAVILGALLIKKVIKVAFTAIALNGIGRFISEQIGKTVAKCIGEDAALEGTGSIIATTIKNSIKSMGGISGMLTMDMGTILGAGTAAEIGLTIGTGIIGGIVAAFAGWNFGQWLNEQITGEEITQSFGEQMKEIKNSFTDGSWKDAIKLWGKDISDGLSAFGDDVNRWMESTFGEWAGTTIPEFFKGIGDTVDTYVKPVFSKEYWNELWDNIKTTSSTKWGEIKQWWETSTFKQLWDEDIAPWFTEEQWSLQWDNIITAFNTKWEELKEWWNTSTLCVWWEEDVSPWFEVSDWSVLWDNVKEAFSTKWNEIKTWWNNTAISQWWNNDVLPNFTKNKWEGAIKGIKEAFESTWEGAIASIKQIWNKFANWLNEKLTWTIDPINIMGQTVFSGTTIKLGKIPTFEVGGFPEDGLFMANHSELVGQFSNGKTAVANNEQIIEGIRRAAYEGMKQALAESNGANVTFKVEGDPNGIFKVVQEESDSYFRRTGNGAFAY